MAARSSRVPLLILTPGKLIRIRAKLVVPGGSGYNDLHFSLIDLGSAKTIRMVYRILADAVVLLHFLFILFVVAGGLLVLYRVYVAVLHLPAALWGAYVEFSGTLCPLTPLENHLSRLAGSAGYSSGFIEHYLVPVIYPAGLTHQIQILLGFFVVAANVLLYFLVLRRYCRHRLESNH